ncbi:class I SAM-dependent methyltransferase [Uliginosibacterium sp. TH139]|uniref:class I SAM-dependent DNA methyltransferase n=1 Tax=Uliginosibacterium sp. TH139 TaxID=2067453 RepID=UPI000C7BB33B|nr:class I SAM-dependent methyltransferase [Uliginosibacterium sp. TH139]PLK48575.1 hypothetical protein C0V76_10965 [Uliginosibacterium sp. TH139]
MTDAISYDYFADIYSSLFDESFLSQFRPWLEFNLRQIEKESKVLDYSCGTGSVANYLSEMGFQVIGVDPSAEMIFQAKKKYRGIDFRCGDVKSLADVRGCALALCNYDSLNHVESKEILEEVFRKIFLTLKDGGAFVFDVNTSIGHFERWKGVFCASNEEFYFSARGRYDQMVNLATYDCVTFKKFDGLEWRRNDFKITQRSIEVSEIREIARNSGFYDLKIFNSLDSFGVKNDTGRIFVVAKK